MAIDQSATVRNQIREFIQGIASAKGVSSFTDQDALTDNGVIDSLSIFRLVSFLEDTFDIRVADEEISSENLKNVEAIERLVSVKLGK